MPRWLLALILAATAVAAGPFEPVAAGDVAYAELQVLEDAGLCRNALVQYEPGRNLTRFQFALLWRAAYEEARSRANRAARPVAAPDGGVRRVVDALGALLEQFGAEIGSNDIDAADARIALAELPHRWPAVSEGARGGGLRLGDEGRPRPSGSAPTGLLSPSWHDETRVGPTALSWAAAGNGIELEVSRQTLPFGADGERTELDTRLSAGLFGPTEAGLSLRELQIVENDRIGPSRLMVGHVLAADLRLKMGDNAVALEYARSLFDPMPGTKGDAEPGAAFKASFLRQLGDDMRLDIGYGRMTTGFTPMASMFGGQTAPDLHGLEAGLAWENSRFGLLGHASLYVPEGRRVGYVNRLGTEMRYAPYDHLQLSLAYQSTGRRRLADIADAWQKYLDARVVYDLSGSLRADFGYRYEVSDGPGVRSTNDHALGVSLGMGF